MIVDEAIQQSVGTKKEKKPKIKYSISNSVLSFMNHTAFIDDSCIKTRDGFTDYLQLENYAVRKETEENQRQALQGLVNLFRGVSSDIKLIFMGYAADTSKQIENIRVRSKRTDLNEYAATQKDHKIWELKKAHKSLLEDIVYIQIFGKDIAALERARTELMNGTNKFINVTELPVRIKKGIMYQLYNLGEQPPEFDDSLSDEELLNRAGEDRKFMSEIQPEGGISSSDNWFSKTGHGYVGVYHLHRFSKKERFYWGEEVFRQPGVITTVDISHMEIAKTKSLITKAIGENDSNAKKGANREIKMGATIEKHLLEDLLEDMLTNNESVKEVTIRYFIAGKDKETVNKIAEKINDTLEFKGYKASFYLGEEDTELRSIYLSQTKQKEKKKRKGKELTTTDLGASYPLNHSQLIDPKGLYLGYTPTNGLVILDMTHKDSQRMSYNFSIIGLPGSGKSSLAKKIGSHNHILGNYTYYFMANGENDLFMHKYGGLTIDASGKDGTANPFQIFATVVDEATGTIDERESYNVSINKLKTIYSTMDGSKDSELLKALGKHFDIFYKEWFKNNKMSFSKATQYPAEKYPILEDFSKYISKLLYDENGLVRTTLSSFEAKRLDKIDSTNATMMQDDAIFNRHTSIDVSSYRSVSFNLFSLLNKGKEIFNAQLYNLLFMVWNLSMVRGMREKNQFDTGAKTIDEVIRSFIIFDEFHNITRQENDEAIDLLDRYEREARKAFGGLGLITHDISDLFNEAASNTFKEKVYKLLKLCTYTFIMQQDPGSIDDLRKAYKETLKDSELRQIPSLKIGQAILSIKGKGNLQVKIDLSKEEKKIFTGGH
ncbi:ATP-binding protein [Enterococcus hulanensis]|uniref:ATP-binding protein n=1 Tax=Enterococcus hulanensis TaxID=2559929 RepID=UPI0010F8AC0D|nr:ATP-binding protein [Enterococcus hulanensis]